MQQIVRNQSTSEPPNRTLPDVVVEAVTAFYHRTPVTTIYGIATLTLALANVMEPRGGLVSVFIGAWGFSLAAYHFLMILFMGCGLLLLLWTPITKRPAPKQLAYPFLFYLGFVVIATFSSSATGRATWESFMKTAATHLAHGWLLTRELTWPD